MKKFVNVIIGIVLLVFCVMNCILVRDLEQKTIDLIELTDIEPEIIFVDSLVYDTVYLGYYDTIQLPIVKIDTLTDTLTLVEKDSVIVQLPIEINHYQDTLLNTAISFDVRGFQCKVDNLYLKSMKVPTIEQKALKKWYNNFSIGVGLSGVYMEGIKIIPSVGIYYTLFSL